MHQIAKIINRKSLIVLLQGFASGLPLALVGSTLQAWFATSGVSVATIGLLTLVGQPYAYKFLWAPLFDRYLPPFLGRRRGWIMVLQICLAISLIAVTFFHPNNNTAILQILALVIAFISASQDIVIDAYRTELLTPAERGLGAALATTGYRIAMLTSGGGALILANFYGWHAVYVIMASIMVINASITLFAPNETVAVFTPQKFSTAIIEPLREFMQRDAAIIILLLVILYKLTDAMANALGSKFLLDLGFSLATIGTVYKGIGLFATLIGAFTGGVLMLRLSLYSAMLWFGIIQASSNLLFAILAHVGANIPFLTVTVFIENFCGGLGNVAFVAFLMSLCNHRYTATQYALLSSAAAVARIYIGPFAGLLAKSLGIDITPVNWAMYYYCSLFVATPSIMLLYILKHRGIFTNSQTGTTEKS